MKKMVTLLALVIAITGCTDVLDKKFDLKTAKEDYAKIREKYKDTYTSEEFGALENDMVAMTITGSKRTYRELLDTIHAKRLRYETALTEYNQNLKKIEEVMKIEVSATELRQGNYGIGNYFGMALEIMNQGNKSIMAYSGTIEVQTLTGTTIGTFKQESSQTLQARDTIKENNWWPVFSNEAIFKEATREKLKITWQPNVIVFENNEKMQAPVKPVNPL